MSLKKYIAEAEVRQHIPQTGDVFAIELEDGTLLETYVMSMQDNVIVLDATPKMIGVLSEWADLDGEADDVLLEGQFDTSMAEDQYSMDDEQYQTEIDVVDRGEYDQEGDMAKDDLATIIRAARKLTGMLDDNENMPEWVQSKINKAADYVDTAADYIESNKQRAREEGVTEGHADQQRKIFKRNGKPVGEVGIDRESSPGVGQWYMKCYEYDVDNSGYDSYEEAVEELKYCLKQGVAEGEMDEAKYQGREVKLGKPTRGDVAKFKVYVRDPSTGNIKKVNFGHGGTSAKRLGQKTMRIKKSDPARRRSFRARHNCDNPGPRTSARYWSCRAW